MPLIGKAAFAVLFIVTAIVGIGASLLQPILAGRQPCRRWFAFCIGVVAACTVFAWWIGSYGLGAAEPGIAGALFGVFAGLVWGSFFSFLNTWVLWQAFERSEDEVHAKSAPSMESDLRDIAAHAIGRIKSFSPTLGIAWTGILPWSIFAAAMMLPAAWTYAFCWLTWLTEGAPGIEPAMPIGD